jgi:N-acetylneuraminate synthase
MADKYGVPVGYSGHESSTSPSIVAAAIGAVAIERHITKSRALYGSDQAASLEPQGLSNLVGAVRKVQLIMGDGIKKVNPKEIEVAKKLRYWLKN